MKEKRREQRKGVNNMKAKSWQVVQDKIREIQRKSLEKNTIYEKYEPRSEDRKEEKKNKGDERGKII